MKALYPIPDDFNSLDKPLTMNNPCDKQDLTEVKELMSAKIDNVITLVTGNDKNYNQRFDNMKEAVRIATVANDKRLDLLNEFKQQAIMDKTHYLDKDLYESKHQELILRIEHLQEIIDANMNKRVGMSMSWGFIIAAVAVISSVVTLILNFRHLFG